MIQKTERIMKMSCTRQKVASETTGQSKIFYIQFSILYRIMCLRG